MAETAGVFSESWYRVADRHAALRPHIDIHRQFYRGDIWHVIQDPINNQFFRLRPAAYDFVARLRLDRTIAATWEECHQANPTEAPGQEDVIRLLGQLYNANLLHSDIAGDSAKLFERYRQRRQRELRSRLASIMSVRIPLFDPDALLKRLLPVAKVVLGPLGALVWFAVVGLAIKVGLEHATELGQASQGVFAPDNLLLLYAGFVVIKAIHEFGHAFMCRRFGGEVHTMGIMFVIFTPMPYVDATSSLAFRSRWRRILVGAGGMIPELFVAAIMMLVWANIGDGTLRSLAYNMMFVASVSTLLFNANPLMRFDGYYIFSDLVDLPNLYVRAGKQVTYLIERHAFGSKNAETPAHDRREAWWLTLYGIAGPIYRAWVFALILFFLAGHYLILGVLMAAIGLVTWLVVPIVRLFVYLATSPRLARCRSRAIAVCSGAAAGLFVLLGVVPFPNDFRAPGILEAVQYSIVANETFGRIDELPTEPGAHVKAGQPLVRLSDPQLEFELDAARAELAETRAMELKALDRGSADLMPIRSRIEALSKRLYRLEQRQQQLTVQARHEGKWAASDLRHASGAWLPRGTPLGYLIDDRNYHLTAAVSQ
jgi:putative peptide zinc metalloprotease protein